MSPSDSSWEIDYQCPQCGAPVTVEETVRLFGCPFCRVRLCFPPDDSLRCYLPPVADLPAEPIFVPYWRVKGMVFSCKEAGTEQLSLDASVLALKRRSFKPSLGIRPQAMRLKLFSPGTPGHPLKYDVPREDILAHVEEQLGSAIVPRQCGPVFHKTFIGETISMIYTPVFVTDGVVYDAITKEPLQGTSRKDVSIDEPAGSKDEWGARFIPALCPDCGWNLAGEGDSVVLFCDHCSSAWKMTGAGLQRLDHAILEADGTADFYLPFWRVRAQVEGLELGSYADLVRLANLPKAARPEWSDKPFYFWVPAFKVRPDLFLRIARQTTISQPDERIAERTTGSSFYPATLADNEAAEFLTVIVGDMAAAKRKVLPRLGEIRIQMTESRLTYIPFISQLGELDNIQMRLSINKNALKYGRNL